VINTNQQILVISGKNMQFSISLALNDEYLA